MFRSSKGFMFLLLKVAAQKHMALITQPHLEILLLLCDGAVGWTSGLGL